MASGPDRRTFLRGAAGAAGLGAVGAFSTKLQFVGASEPPGQPALVPITVALEQFGPAANPRFRVKCEDKIVPKNSELALSSQRM